MYLKPKKEKVTTRLLEKRCIRQVFNNLRKRHRYTIFPTVSGLMISESFVRQESKNTL